ncbi:MAG: 2-oxoacid:acceptor oxidoreductase family protein [Bacillota bacterium]
MTDYFECRFSGFGGQGIMLAGLILAEAAGVYEEKNVVQTRSYGPEARGSACRSEVIISQSPIDYLEVTRPDFLLALTQEAFDKYLPEVKENGVIVVDPDYVQKRETNRQVRVIPVPVTAIAREKVGNPVTANVVALGVMGAVTNVVSRDSLAAAVQGTAPRGTETINLEALAAGYEAVEGLTKSSGFQGGN